MLTPNDKYEIPAMTAEVARAAFPKGNAVMKLRDELGPLFEDVDFAALSTSRCRSQRCCQAQDGRGCGDGAKCRHEGGSGASRFGCR